MEIRIQRWLAEYQKFSDRSMVNECLVFFNKIFKMVMNSSLNVILFIKPPPKNPSPKLNPMQGLDSEEIRPWAYWYAHRVSLDRTGGLLKYLTRHKSETSDSCPVTRSYPNHQNSAFSCSLTHQSYC